MSQIQQIIHEEYQNIKEMSYNKSTLKSYKAERVKVFLVLKIHFLLFILTVI